MASRASNTSMVGTWRIERANHNTDVLDSTELIVRVDSATPTSLDGVSPVPNAGDMIFYGTVSADGRVWKGTVSQPGSAAQSSFLFVATADFEVIAGWVVDPTNNHNSAWAGVR